MSKLMMNLILVMFGFSMIRIIGSGQPMQADAVYLWITCSFFSGYDAGRSHGEKKVKNDKQD